MALPTYLTITAIVAAAFPLTSCTPVSANISDYSTSILCSFYKSCSGRNQVCINNICRCKFGTVTTLTNPNECVNFYCTSDYQCHSSISILSRCSFGSCVCDYNYYLDTSTNSCRWSSSYYRPTVNVRLYAFIIGCFVFAFFVSIISIIVRRRRALRMVQARSVAGRRVVIQPQTRHQQYGQMAPPPTYSSPLGPAYPSLATYGMGGTAPSLPQSQPQGPPPPEYTNEWANGLKRY